MTKTTSDVVAFEKALDGVGRAELESRYRRAVFELEEATVTLTIAQERGTALWEENVELKNALRVVKILIENKRVDRALECLIAALHAQPPPEGV
jgi:hypothetical protein